MYKSLKPQKFLPHKLKGTKTMTDVLILSIYLQLNIYKSTVKNIIVTMAVSLAEDFADKTSQPQILIA